MTYVLIANTSNVLERRHVAGTRHGGDLCQHLRDRFESRNEQNAPSRQCSTGRS